MTDKIMEVNEEKERPAFLYWILEEPGDTEAMTMPELAYEIEKQNYNLSCLKAVEFGEECIDKPSNWLDLMDQTTDALQQLRLSLEQRMEEALGVQTEELPCEEEEPEEFKDLGITAWAAGSELENPAQHTEVEGFIDDKNRFLDRYDAFAHALECGQLPETVRIHKADHRENQLYSEDLY